ncbi:DUF1735 domain-containing protein [Elizabethkingia meningoseptica]|uniref:DUF1735 domain-containing protein n=1 Tax=Elizabethkingia meningoseptica TaxID=238 RepID=UPI0023B1308B|nr:DUF1735 domain-containing protein [Elizabethkingia meningoseptica]MDE5493482.1 DUF1735 domain-containing protein [Elizabethkingia meningoseptica]
MKNFIKYTILMLLLATYACTNNEMTTFPSAIYFEGSTGTNITNISIDKNGSQIPIAVRAAKPLDSKTSITVQIDSKALEQYNKEKSSNYQILPANYYTFSNHTLTIEKGNYISEASPLSVKDISNLPEVNKHALAVTITQIEGNTPSLKI